MSHLPMSAAWWRPIESAPKDCRVLVVSEGGTMHTARKLFFLAERFHLTDTERQAVEGRKADRDES